MLAIVFSLNSKPSSLCSNKAIERIYASFDVIEGSSGDLAFSTSAREDTKELRTGKNDSGCSNATVSLSNDIRCERSCAVTSSVQSDCISHVD